MKILMVLERNFPPDVRVEHEIVSLVTAGHEVVIACFDQKGAPLKEEWNGALIYRKPISNFIYKTNVGCLKFPFYFNFWQTFLNDICKDQNFEAVHIHDLPLAQVGLQLKKKYGLRLILDLHENWPALLEVSPHVKSFLGRILSSDSQWRDYEQRMVQEADEVIAVVEENGERLKQLTASPKKVHIVSNTPTLVDIYNLAHDPQEETKSDKMILFYGGGVTKHRGLQYILPALAELENNNIQCWIVGDGSYLHQLRNLAEELKLQDQVIFWGWKSLNEMMTLMRRSNVLLIPHTKSMHTDTTIPHKLFQYMATGKPILATNCDPIERIINETNSGLIYKFDDIRNISKQIHTLYRKWESGDKLKTEGAQHIRDKYNWSVDEEVLLNIYNHKS